MITGSNSSNSHESSPDSITSALDLLLEEIDMERDRVKDAGSNAFHVDDHGRVEALSAQLKALTEFYGKAAALHKEWRKLAKTAVLNGDGKSGSGRRNFGKLRKGLRTPESEFIEPILRMLIELGGQGKGTTIVARVGEIMQPVLGDVDYETLPGDGKPRWEKATHWARRHMVLDGLLKSDSPRGLWEISEAGRARLES